MKKIAIMLGLILLIQKITFAQNSVVLPVDSLIKAALEIDEQKKIINFEKKKTELDQKKLLTTFLPDFNLTGMYNHQSEVAELSLSDIPFPVGTIQAGVYDQYDFSMQLRALLFDGFSRLHQKRLLSANLEEQNYRFRYRQQEIKFQVYMQTFQYLYRVRTLQALRNSLDRLLLQMQRVSALFEQGFASAIDTLELSGRINEIRLQEISLKSSIKQALQDLELLTAIPQIDSVLIDESEIQLTIPQTKEILNYVNNNFDLKLLSIKSQKLQFLKKQQYASFLPKIYLAFAYHYGRPGVNFFEDKWMDYWTAGVQFSWNLWRWGRDRATLQQREHAIREVALQQQLMQRAAKVKVEKYQQQIRQLSQERALLEKMIAEKQKKFELVKQRWEQGLQTTLDVVQAEKELTDTEMKKSLNEIQAKIVYLLLNKEIGFSF